MTKLLVRMFTLLMVLGLMSGCASSGDDPNSSHNQGEPPMDERETGTTFVGDVAASNLDYDASPDVPAETVGELVYGNTQFTLDLYLPENSL